MVEMTIQDEIADISIGRPHVVLLGAGASRAAFPRGEKNGKLLPLMSDFAEIAPLGDILTTLGVDPVGCNLEEVYSTIASDPKKSSQRQELEKAIFDYFSALELPKHPTLFDHLILSLRTKDVIATFNWDPFLIQAACRNRPLSADGRFSETPHLLFLHGNVAQGYCEQDKVHGAKGRICSRCGKPFEPVRLLYPIREKDYRQNPAIGASWSHAQWALKNACMVTVFGYGAPETDRDAIDLLRSAWGDWANRSLEQFEFIDICEEQQLIQRWDGFVSPRQGHYDIHQDFYESWIARHPRRTGEAWWNQFMEAKFISENPIPHTAGFEDLWDWFEPLISAERSRDMSVGGQGTGNKKTGDRREAF